MVKRKKRLEKSIESIDKQIELHEEKMQEAQEQNKEELVLYYEKELRALEERKQNRQDKLDKQ